MLRQTGTLLKGQLGRNDKDNFFLTLIYIDDDSNRGRELTIRIGKQHITRFGDAFINIECDDGHTRNF